MKLVHRYLILALALLIVGGAITSQAKTRKLPISTYIKSAKIEILSGDEDRIPGAVALLDSLFMNYGPHAEGLYWMTQIQVDYIERKANLDEKKPYVEKMVAYADSLRACCGNKDIKKKYRKNCDEYVAEIDSTRVLYWRTYYNAAVEQITEVEEITETLKEVTTAEDKEFYETRRAALIDSTKDRMYLAILIDSTDARTYIGLGSAYEKSEDYPTAIEWLERGLAKAGDRAPVAIRIAYDYIQMGEFCKTIPYFREYIDANLADTAVMADEHNRSIVISTMHNLAICYNNCQRYDEAFGVFEEIMALDPDDVEAVTGAGRYFTHIAQEALDSANVYRDQENQAKAKEWQDVRMERFERARGFLKHAFELKQDDIDAAEEYAIVAVVLQNNEEAAVAFARACELDPTRADNWRSLGDRYLKMESWPECAAAYEKVVELQPDNVEIWKSLKALYIELGKKQARINAEAKIKKLSGN